MIRLVRFSILTAVCIFFVTSTAFAEAPLTLYKNDAQGFALSFPGNWEIKEAKGGMEVFGAVPPRESTAEQFRPNAHVELEILPEEETVDEYAQTYFAKIQTRMTDLKVLKRGRQSISHTSARWWVITFREKTVDVKGFLFIVLKGKRAFAITTVAPLAQYRAYKDVLADIGGSLSIY